MNLQSQNNDSRHSLNGFESLEERLLLTVNIQFDYSLDTQNFFGDVGSDQRLALEAAGDYLGSQLNDTLLALPTSFSDIGEWRGGVAQHPGTGATGTNGAYKIPQAFDVPENTLVVFVGGQSLNGSIGEAGPGIIFQRDTIFTTGDAAQHRGQTGAASANPTDFAPWGGAATFDNDGSTNWYFDTTDPADGLSSGELGFNEVDFFSVAIHELGHVLGVGTAESWFENISGSQFTGAAATASFGGSVPLGGGGGHWAEGTTLAGEASAFDPILSNPRVLMNDLDRAGLTDIGWEVGTNNVLSLSGTSGNDSVRITVRPTTVVVKTNSVVNTYQLADFDSLSFDGLGGSDRLIVDGTTGDDNAFLWTNRFRQTGSNYEINTDNFERVIVNAGGGTDVANLYDSAGRDRFVGFHHFSQLTGAGFFNRVKGFDRVITTSSAGNDVAVFQDRATVDDRFDARDTYSELTGDTYYYRANGFGQVVGRSSGGNDIASMYDSDGDDVYVGRSNYSDLRGSGYFNRSIGFAEVRAFASGGFDLAQLIDSSGNDNFFSQNTYGGLSGTGFSNNTLDFDKVSIFGVRGGINTIFAGTRDFIFRRFGTWRDQ